MPLPASRVIHPRFQAHHQPTVTGTMQATCRLLRPGTDDGTAVGFDEATGRSVYPDPPMVWQGRCRVLRTSRAEQHLTPVDREVAVQGFIVALPADTPDPQIADLVHILTCPQDPLLVGQRLLVTQVRGGSIRWERDLVCEWQPPHTR